ncbi:LSM domain [Carpediemonas membranifera]|uniref:Small nuclear ribonucleoprotein E n=1 Tax=Carpediemonas membranifera TaxID=201153 RepID=A0A8J6E7Z9_9EUKA|nr:LSM domain [Carpediemonas membranifera]|eukprot:KAG9391255.1 LSM domain [Carpediemonas membranifera]
MNRKSAKGVLEPIVYSYLKGKETVTVWLRDMRDFFIKGRIVGFDEFMNLTLADAVEVNRKKETRRVIGTILLKGENVLLISQQT